MMKTPINNAAQVRIEPIKDQVLTFLAEFRMLSELPPRDLTPEHKSFFESLSELFGNEDLLDELQGRRYNVFNILDLEKKEVGFHTPMLTNLLDIKGSHLQGNRFFNAFLATLPNIKLANESFSQNSIDREYITRYGIVDILISCTKKNNPFFILIENKIHAGDQSKQLERYAEYLQYALRLTKDQFVIIYLTPNGNSPNVPHSISVELYKDLIESGNIIEISYKITIKKWIESLLTENIPIRIKSTIEQYIQTINSF